MYAYPVAPHQATDHSGLLPTFADIIDPDDGEPRANKCGPMKPLRLRGFSLARFRARFFNFASDGWRGSGLVHPTGNNPGALLQRLLNQGRFSSSSWNGGTPRILPPSRPFSNNLIILGLLFSLNRVVKADPCDKGAVAASEGANHLGGFLIGVGVLSTPWGKAALQSPVGKAALAGLISYSSTRQFMTETDTGQVAEQFWHDTFASAWAAYYGL